MEDFFYETDYYSLKFQDEILHVSYLKGPITISVAKDIVKKRLELTDEKDVLALIVVVGPKSVDREARGYLSSDEALKGVKAGAICTVSPFTKHLANFFLKVTVNKPKVPTRVFSDMSEATTWLQQFK